VVWRRTDSGKIAEEEAVRFLTARGYRIIQRNFRTRWAEIDLVGLHRGVICFIEVKMRSQLEFGLPQEAVDKAKQKRIALAALSFLQKQKKLDAKVRFDVVSVTGNIDSPKISLIKNAFEIEGDGWL